MKIYIFNLLNFHIPCTLQTQIFFFCIKTSKIFTSSFQSLQTKDVAVAVVTSILDSGLVLQLLCLDDGKNRDIDDLGITVCKNVVFVNLYPAKTESH